MKTEKVYRSMKLSSTALQLRSMRMQKYLSFSEVSEAFNIAYNDIVLFEMGKKNPTQEELNTLLAYYKQ